jgi:ANTAR domain/PAS fold
MTSVAFDGSQPHRPVGRYTYSVASATWWWSDQVYRLHGYEPRQVPATTDVLLQHKHPDDRGRTAEVFERVLADGEPFSCYHRVVDFSERVRSVVSVGHGVRDAAGRVERVEGFFVDLTQARRDETEAEVRDALARIAEHRETIDLAKGMVMLATCCTPDEAFAVLRRTSQRHNRKLREVARRLVTAVGDEVVHSDGVLPFLERVGEPGRRTDVGAR